MKSIILLGSILFLNSFLSLEPQGITTSYSYTINGSFENHEYTTNKNKSNDLITKSSPNYNEGKMNIMELPTVENSPIEAITLDN